MARVLLFCLVLADLAAALATATRPFLGVIHVHGESSEVDWHVVAHPPAASDEVHLSVPESSGLIAGAPKRAFHHLKHESHSKSIIGAEVILGSFATAAAVAVFCYIRITRRRSAEEKS